MMAQYILGLGTPVVPFYPSYFGVSLLKLNIRKRGSPIIMGLLGNLGGMCYLRKQIRRTSRGSGGLPSLRLVELILLIELCNSFNPYTVGAEIIPHILVINSL